MKKLVMAAVVATVAWGWLLTQLPDKFVGSWYSCFIGSIIGMYFTDLRWKNKLQSPSLSLTQINITK